MTTTFEDVEAIESVLDEAVAHSEACSDLDHIREIEEGIRLIRLAIESEPEVAAKAQPVVVRPARGAAHSHIGETGVCTTWHGAMSNRAQTEVWP